MSGSFGSNGRSSGFVHTTDRSGSATSARIVFDDPSAIPWIVSFAASGGESVFFPDGTRYAVFPAALSFSSGPK